MPAGRGGPKPHVSPHGRLIWCHLVAKSPGLVTGGEQPSFGGGCFGLQGGKERLRFGGAAEHPCCMLGAVHCPSPPQAAPSSALANSLVLNFGLWEEPASDGAE